MTKVFPIVSARKLISKHPIGAAVLVAALLRLLSALSGVGWFALDDYVYVIEPAWRWLSDPALPYPSALRSTLLAKATFACMRVARGLGAQDPATLLRFTYVAIGFWSVAAIPPVFFLTRRRLGDDAARLAVWLMATYALMPLISTRTLIEVVAIVPLCWGLMLVDSSGDGSARRRFLVTAAGAICLGAAAMLRFQVGLLWIAAAGWIAWQCVRQRTDERFADRWAATGGILAGGVVALLMAGGADLAEGRPFLGTVWAYLLFNIGNPERFGASAWYTYLLQLVVYTIPPATLLLARPLWRAARSHPLVGTGLAFFVVMHSAIGHKEDRFLFSVLPLVFVLLGAALAELRRGSRRQRGAYRFFWVVNLVVLAVAITSDAQRNLTVPLLELGRRDPVPTVAVVGLLNVPAFYFGDDANLAEARRLDALFEHVESNDWKPQAILFRPVPEPETLDRLRRAGLACGEPTIYNGDLVDRALVALNPRHNKRRVATGLVECVSD